MKCKEENKLTKARVLRKFVETFRLKLEKILPLPRSNTPYWRLVRDRDGVIYQLYAPSHIEIYTFGPQTVILDFLLNDIPWWYERWPEGKVEFVNPLFSCKSLEEAMMKLDLFGEEKA